MLHDLALFSVFTCYTTIATLHNIYKLWLIIILMVLTSSSTSYAEHNQELSFPQPTQQDYASAREVINNVQQNMLPGLTQGKTSEANFYIFISFSLSKQNLAELLSFAKKYQGQLVLRGLKSNSFKETGHYLQELELKEGDGGMIIDPMLFTTYQVQAVPCYVLAKNETCLPNTSCKPIYDKLTGNVTAKYALEQFNKLGDLSDDANNILGVANGH